MSYVHDITSKTSEQQRTSGIKTGHEGKGSNVGHLVRGH